MGLDSGYLPHPPFVQSYPNTVCAGRGREGEEGVRIKVSIKLIWGGEGLRRDLTGGKYLAECALFRTTANLIGDAGELKQLNPRKTQNAIFGEP